MIHLKLTRERAESLRDQLGTYLPYGNSPLLELFNELNAALDAPPAACTNCVCGKECVKGA